MHAELLDEIRAILDTGERTLFPYFKDRYALWLLGRHVGAGARVRELKKGRYASLMNKPLVKKVTAAAPNGIITPYELASVWPHDALSYRITLGSWAGCRRGWGQTSRVGTNLVLQLNFSNRHNAHLRRLEDRYGDKVFNHGGHPVSERENTLGWVRIDLDLESGEALIEEIQSDWIRDALSYYAHCKALDPQTPIWGGPMTAGHMQRYFTAAIAPHLKIWDEALLNAALWLLREEIGIGRIWYHTWEGGIRLKNIHFGRKPPKSLYTQLPRRFCFERTDEAPGFLVRHHRRRRPKLGCGLQFFCTSVT